MADREWQRLVSVVRGVKFRSIKQGSRVMSFDPVTLFDNFALTLL
eukprot:CAMPEP_0185566950 /NCGR_PEP_ID=MMETSP0434-20130131/355_1 /TAXON_ID=626734 ORGANISM="Favella taraikaensis, Strain Fe Narragansett Bay" /NCGR_SAMPLE_ID=MMETSP0434 /ASSEMBLY_ACC=CAM_ASM_000379 /LENGTH=44 /DNA_ID= /DNA_START= /DNA_END= /DNA_ORIENTATION=